MGADYGADRFVRDPTEAFHDRLGELDGRQRIGQEATVIALDRRAVGRTEPAGDVIAVSGGSNLAFWQPRPGWTVTGCFESCASR